MDDFDDNDFLNVIDELVEYDMDINTFNDDLLLTNNLELES